MSTKDYTTRDLIVSYDASRCIHAAECVRGAPAVFDPAARPWIQPGNGSAEEIAAVVRRCPTGALTVRRVDGSPIETPDAANNLTVTPDGPLYLRGRVVFEGGAHASQVEYMRVALCRCGQSKNKPLCDGSHKAAGFADPGRYSGPPDDATPGVPTGFRGGSSSRPRMDRRSSPAKKPGCAAAANPATSPSAMEHTRRSASPDKRDLSIRLD